MIKACKNATPYVALGSRGPGKRLFGYPLTLKDVYSCIFSSSAIEYLRDQNRGRSDVAVACFYSDNRD